MDILVHKQGRWMWSGTGTEQGNGGPTMMIYPFGHDRRYPVIKIPTAIYTHNQHSLRLTPIYTTSGIHPIYPPNTTIDYDFLQHHL
ncbi:unnamed protein product [Absidia cylindrospora]